MPTSPTPKSLKASSGSRNSLFAAPLPRTVWLSCALRGWRPLCLQVQLQRTVLNRKPPHSKPHTPLKSSNTCSAPASVDKRTSILLLLLLLPIIIISIMKILILIIIRTNGNKNDNTNKNNNNNNNNNIATIAIIIMIKIIM